MKFKYFTKEEFACPCGKCENKISDKFISLLDDLRGKIGKPMIVNSGYRCPEHNEKIGGRPNSAHLDGVAADISVKDSRTRYNLVSLALEKFNRVGVAKTFIHLDIAKNKPLDVMWTY